MANNMDTPQEYVECFRKIGLVIGKRLGSGSSGTVYQATQPKLSRELAVKLFDHPSQKFNPLSRKRFEHEARLLARSQHPAIPFVLSFGEASLAEASVPCIIMQFIDGCSLAEIIEKGRQDSKVATLHVKQLLGALACVHQNKIIHRDVKPENILVSKTGHCYLIDFSIGASLVPVSGLTRVTGDNRTPGTWAYAAPEQIAGKETDCRADLFSLGLVLFELLAGRRLSGPALIESDLLQIPSPFKDLLQKACHPEPTKRFQNANDFDSELDRINLTGAQRLEPSDALCLNARCPTTNWRPNGGYDSPGLVRNTRKPFCGACGGRLSYPCVHCGAKFEESPYCADCGGKNYESPKCLACGTELELRDIDRDTSVDGCSNCPLDDGIPF